MNVLDIALQCPPEVLKRAPRGHEAEHAVVWAKKLLMYACLKDPEPGKRYYFRAITQDLGSFAYLLVGTYHAEENKWFVEPNEYKITSLFKEEVLYYFPLPV